MSAASELITSFAQDVTVTRKSASGTFTQGKWVEGGETTFTATMSMQPLTDKELLNLPEGQRTRRAIKGYTATLLKTAQKEGGTDADRVSFEGKSFEVMRVEHWQYDFDFYKVVLQEVNT